MEDKEFNLSEKIGDDLIHVSNVKEFIRRLEEEIDETWKDVTDTYIDSGTISKMHKLWLIEKLHKLAGDDLIK